MAAKRDAGIACGLRVGSGETHFISPAGKVQNAGDEQRQRDRQRKSPVNVAPYLWNVVPDPRGGSECMAARIEPWSRRDIVGEQSADEIQQERRDEFADPGIGASKR